MHSHPAGYAHEEPTHPPPWHGLVVWDVFLNALTTGLFLAAAVGELAAPATFAPVGRWAYPLALALLLADLTLLVLDLGDRLRFHHMLRVFKPSSPMSLGTWCLTAYSLPLTAVVALDVFAAFDSVRTVLLAVSLPFAFGSMAYKGVLFSTSSQPGWRDARWLGAYHTASALALGSVLLLALAALTGEGRAAAALARGAAALLALQCVPLTLLWIELRPALRARYPVSQLRLTAAVAVVGAVIPVGLLLTGTEPAPVVVAAALALAGGWVVRYRVVALPHAGHGESRPAS